ncbi:MAG: hypothetical protein J6W70_05305 [Lentisphaeria bacterium]|nr:hypothetical protein [Lentisphaeria bacterium]
MEHQNAGTFIAERTVRFQNLPVNLRTFAFANQRVIIGNGLRGADFIVVEQIFCFQLGGGRARASSQQDGGRQSRRKN